MLNKRVLIVTPVFTHPPSQGNAARILAFGRELKARGFTVDVLHYCLDLMTPEGESQMAREWNKVVLIPARPHKPQSHPAYWGLDDWCPDEVCDVVRQLTQTGSYSAVIANYIWMSRCLVDVAGPLRIIDTHDLFGDRHLLSLQWGLDPNWFFTTVAEETRAFDRADVVLGIQSEETELIASRTKSRTLTVGHPMEAWFLKNPDSANKVSAFGFLGSGNPWNVGSVVALDEALTQKQSPISWSIAGTICRTPLDLASRPYIFGGVAKPEDFYCHIDCAINPMIGGTGLKIKTIEGMAYGRCLIGTQHATAGLEVEHEMHRLATVGDVADAMQEYQRCANLRLELFQTTRRLFTQYTARTDLEYDKLVSVILHG